MVELSLGDKQRKFSLMAAKLIIAAYEMGYEITLGNALRCQDCKTGRKESLHKEKLAIDLNLFRNGVYLTSTEDHRPLGELWESWGGTWGGSGNRNDGNHYSLKHNGRW